MLINGEDKRGFSLNQGKSADQIRFFSTEVCSADFHPGEVTVVEFGSRPAKRARLPSDKDSSVKKDQVSSICARSLAQGDFLESDGDVGGQRYQADEPMSESNSGVTDELRSKSAGLKVISSVHTSEHMEKRGSIKVLSEQTSGAQDDVKKSLLNHENIDRDAGSTKPLIQQDADDTISSSDDDGMFVIQVRSPKSKQLLHSQKQGIDQEKLPRCDGAASSQTTGKQDSHDNSETLLHCPEGGRIVGYCSYKSAEDDEKAKLDAEEVDSSIEVSNIILAGADSKLDTCRGADDQLVTVLATDLETKNVDGSKYDQQVEESLRISSDARYMELADADERISCGTKSLFFTETCTSLRAEVQPEGAGSFDHGDQSDKVIQKAPGARVHEAECCVEPGVNSSEIPKDCAQARKRSSTTQVATIGAVALQDNNGSCRSGDALDCLNLKDEDPPSERIIKHYVRRPHSRANSHGPEDMTEKSSAKDPGVNSSEIPKVYVRTRKQTCSTQIATVGAAALQEYDGSSKSEDALHRFHLEGGDPLGESIIKHYVRRPHSRANSHGPADTTEKSSGCMMTSATNVSACSPQAEHHKDMSARVETEGIFSVFQRRSKINSAQQDLHKNDNIVLQKVTPKRSAEACYVRADHQPRWLPEGWTLEIRIREGKKTPARIRDKYYHDKLSGHRFRSRNEVLQFLDYERLARDRMASDGVDTRVQLHDEKNLPRPIAPAEHIGFQSSLSKPPLVTQTIFGSLAAPSPSFTHLNPPHMKTTPARPTSAVSTEANGAAMTWGHVEGPNGPIQLPWGPRGVAVAAGTDQGDQGDQGGNALKNAVASAFDGGAANSSRILKSREGDRLLTASPVPAVESPGDRGDNENRGKLILRLKRKQPGSDVGKGRSKRPMYEVVHVERPPLFTSTPPQQEKTTLREKTGPVVASIPVEPSSAEDITYERPPSIALEQPASMKAGLGYAATVSKHWGINQNPQHLDVLQQEPYTALGIPATARTSGLQTMASYSANHTHVFLDPVENTIPLSWQYPFTTQVTTSVPTFGPFPSVKNPSVSSTFSIATTVPIPTFEHFPGVCSSVHVKATTTVLPCSDNRSRFSISDVVLADNGPLSHKALTVPRPLTKMENSQLLLGLGRHLCKLAGLEHRARAWSLQARPLATRLKGKGLRCSKMGV